MISLLLMELSYASICCALDPAATPTVSSRNFNTVSFRWSTTTTCHDSQLLVLVLVIQHILMIYATTCLALHATCLTQVFLQTCRM